MRGEIGVRCGDGFIESDLGLGTWFDYDGARWIREYAVAVA